MQVSPIEMFKACKNSAEVAGLRAASVRDSLAICRTFAWLRGALKQQCRTPAAAAAAAEQPPESAAATPPPISEADVADRVGAARRAMERCVGDSFPTISSR